MLNLVFDHQFLFVELPQAIRPQPQGTATGRMSVAEPNQTQPPRQAAFVGIDYAALEPRVMADESVRREFENRVLGRFEPPEHVSARSTVASVSTADREEERLGTRVFTPEFMFEMIERGSTGPHMDLTLWRLMIPDHFKEGVDWVIDERILRRLGNLQMRRGMIHAFVQNFQDFKTTAMQAGDLTRTGWVTPASYRSESERRARAEMEERRGRGRRRALDYLDMMRAVMGPQFESQLVPLLERNPGNRDLINEFRYRADYRARAPQGLQGRNPLLMVLDEPAVVQSAPKVKEPKKTKQDPAEQIEQLTQFGKRKIQLDDGDSNG